MGGSSLAELYGLACVVRVSCTVVGLGGEVGTQSIFVSEFPPSVRLTPATSDAELVPLGAPRGTAHLWLLLCSRWDRWRGCRQSISESESPPLGGRWAR